MPRPTRSPSLEPRKRPRQPRAEETVAILVEAAAQVLESSGLEGYNTNAVAARAGVSVGSLYQYFANKDALTVALMKREDARFAADLDRALALGGGRAALDGFIDAVVRQQLARPRLARLLDVEEGRPDVQRAVGGSRRFGPLLARVLASPDLPAQRRPRIAARDVGAILRGLADAAGARGETGAAGLRRRIAAAVYGYLERMAAAETMRATPPRRRSRRPQAADP